MGCEDKPLTEGDAQLMGQARLECQASRCPVLQHVVLSLVLLGLVPDEPRGTDQEERCGEDGDDRSREHG